MVKFCPGCGKALVYAGRGLRGVSLFGCRACDRLYEQPRNFSGEDTGIDGLKKRTQKFSEWKKQQNPPPMTWEPTGADD